MFRFNLKSLFGMVFVVAIALIATKKLLDSYQLSWFIDDVQQIGSLCIPNGRTIEIRDRTLTLKSDPNRQGLMVVAMECRGELKGDVLVRRSQQMNLYSPVDPAMAICVEVPIVNLSEDDSLYWQLAPLADDQFDRLLSVLSQSNLTSVLLVDRSNLNETTRQKILGLKVKHIYVCEPDGRLCELMVPDGTIHGAE